MSFLSQLKPSDLARLRKVVKRVHMQSFPESAVNDYEADRVIEALGPDVAERELARKFKSLGFGMKTMSGPGLRVPKPPEKQQREYKGLALPDGFSFRVTKNLETGDVRSTVTNPGRRK